MFRAAPTATRCWLDWGFIDPMKLELQSQDHAKIYASDQGYCCIQQYNGLEVPSVILIAPNQVDELCRMLQSVKESAESNRREYLEQEEVG